MLRQAYHCVLAWLTPGWVARRRQARAIQEVIYIIPQNSC